MTAATAAPPTPAPIPAFAPVDRPVLEEGVEVAGWEAAVDEEAVVDVVESDVLLAELVTVVAEGLTFVCTPCALSHTPCPCWQQARLPVPKQKLPFSHSVIVTSVVGELESAGRLSQG